MPRLRTIKPGYFRNEDLAALPPLSRILFAGLWCWADKAGRLEDRPRRIGVDVLPYEGKSEAEIDAMIEDLAGGEFLTRYEVEGRRFIQIAHWDKHQKPHKTEGESDIPPCPKCATTVRNTLNNRRSSEGDCLRGMGDGGKAKAVVDVSLKENGKSGRTLDQILDAGIRKELGK